MTDEPVLDSMSGTVFSTTPDGRTITTNYTVYIYQTGVSTKCEFIGLRSGDMSIANQDVMNATREFKRKHNKGGYFYDQK